MKHIMTTEHSSFSCTLWFSNYQIMYFEHQREMLNADHTPHLMMQHIGYFRFWVWLILYSWWSTCQYFHSLTFYRRFLYHTYPKFQTAYIVKTKFRTVILKLDSGTKACGQWCVSCIWYCTLNCRNEMCTCQTKIFVIILWTFFVNSCMIQVIINKLVLYTVSCMFGLVDRSVWFNL